MSRIKKYIQRVTARRSRFLVKAIVMVGVLWSCGSTEGFATPVELFNSPVDVRCESSSLCSGISRSGHSLGRYTGISISKRGGGSASVSVERNEGGMHFELSEASPVVLTLTWDGDQHPEQLSGAGLNCLDLTQGGAYAFIISGISIESECSEESNGQGCPNFQIESRIYDAGDPTGQRYSVSMMTRSLPEKTDLVVPFSNFVREGPRGKGNIGCVGAVSIAFRFEDFESVELDLGAIYTNGAEGLTPLPTATAALTVTPVATPTEQAAQTAVFSDPTVVWSPTPTQVIPSAIPSSEVARLEPTPVDTPLMQALVSPRVPAPADDEEVTYGQLVEGQ